MRLRRRQIDQLVAEVRQLDNESNRWMAVENELRALRNGVSGANLLRRQRVALRAAQAFGIGAELARDPAYAVLVPHWRGQAIEELQTSQERGMAQTQGTPTPPAPEVPPYTASEEPGPSGNPQP